MRLTQPLLKLRKRYCAETLAAEVRTLPPSAWLPHPGASPGNDAVPLIGKDGQASNAFYGRMMPTEHLRRCRYIMEIMADIGAVWGRSRLMGLARAPRCRRTSTSIIIGARTCASTSRSSPTPA